MSDAGDPFVPLTWSKTVDLNSLPDDSYALGWVEDDLRGLLGMQSLPATLPDNEYWDPAGRALREALDARALLATALAGLAEQPEQTRQLLKLVDTAIRAGRGTAAAIRAQTDTPARPDAAAAADRTRAATDKRTRWDWRDGAQACWARNPTWATHRVARAIAGVNDDISSVSRAIREFAPRTSPSYRGA